MLLEASDALNTLGLNVKRMKVLIELSQIRQMSLDELMLQLELRPAHA